MLFPGVALLQVLLPLVMLAMMLVVKHQQRQTILKSNDHPELFTRLIVPAGSILFDAINDGEFVYQGKLFDVSSVMRKGDSYHIIALPDGAETRLQQGATAGHGKPGEEKLRHFPPFILLFFEQADGWLPATRQFYIVFNTLYKPITQQYSPTGHSPPPRLQGLV